MTVKTYGPKNFFEHGRSTWILVAHNISWLAEICVMPTFKMDLA